MLFDVESVFHVPPDVAERTELVLRADYVTTVEVGLDLGDKLYCRFRSYFLGEGQYR